MSPAPRYRNISGQDPPNVSYAILIVSQLAEIKWGSGFLQNPFNRIFIVGRLDADVAISGPRGDIGMGDFVHLATKSLHLGGRMSLFDSEES